MSNLVCCHGIQIVADVIRTKGGEFIKVAFQIIVVAIAAVVLFIPVQRLVDFQLYGMAACSGLAVAFYQLNAFIRIVDVYTVPHATKEITHTMRKVQITAATVTITQYKISEAV
tara:strand:+ start:143 stop:484 length:342 start_codon:yes stop_codon:yes gene_type:complete